MIKKENNLFECNKTLKKRLVCGKPFLYGLMISTSLVCSALAETIVQEFNLEYLNSLTGPKVSWEDTEYGVEFTYNKPDGYEYSSSGELTEENMTNKVIEKTSYSWGGASAVSNASTYDKPIYADFVNNDGWNIFMDTDGAAIYNSGSFSDINGSFVGNFSDGLGGAVYNQGSINSINGDFIANSTYSEGGYSKGGAIYNQGEIGSIVGNFIWNDVADYGVVYGGAIYNIGTIGNITGDFVSNYISNYYGGVGGAIYNSGTINLLNSNFYDNAVLVEYDDVPTMGGAIYNENILNITADKGNSVFARNIVGIREWNSDIQEYEVVNAKSNAIHSDGGEIKLTAINDGVIHFEDGIVLNDTAFNIAGDDSGKIVFNAPLEVTNSEIVQKGANVYFGEASPIKGYTYITEFGVINNANVIDGRLYLGEQPPAPCNENAGDENVVNKAVANNTTIDNQGVMYVYSGAMANDTVVNSGGELYAQNEATINNLLANGGSLIDLDMGTILTGDIHFNVDAILQGGYDYNKIFEENVTDTGSLTLEGGFNAALDQDSLINEAKDKSLVLDGGNFEVGLGVQEVSGWKELNVKDNTTVKLAGDIALAEINNKLNLLQGATLDLAGNSPLEATINGSLNNDGNMVFTHSGDSADDHITVKGNYRAYKNASMTIDVDVADNKADVLTIEGDVAGRTKVVINPINDNGGTSLMTDKAVFVNAPNDNMSTGAYFDVYRMIADARVWNSLYENNKWYVGTSNVIENSQSGYGSTDDEKELIIGETDDDLVEDNGNNNPENGEDDSDTENEDVNSGGNVSDASQIEVVSEAVAYMSLPRIGLEQNKDLTRVVSNKVAATKNKCDSCGMKEYRYKNEPLSGAWVNLEHKKSDIDAPVDVDAKINAVDFGFDLQTDRANRLGVFASYRQGEYDLSGKGDKYYSKVGSDIDIDSWMLGLYHRYDCGRLWTMSSIYGGVQDVDMTTDDGVVSDTNGMQFGGSLEAGLIFELQKSITIEPSVRLGYNFLKYDDMSDDYGKTAKFDDVHNVEAEAGVKLEKTFFGDKNKVISKIYVKPSVIRSFGKGDINITSLETVDGLDNETFVRGEVGGSFNFGNGWSGFGSLGYTTGSDYEASDFNLGVNYNW